MILVRHGETEFNRQFRARRLDPGIHDPPLTADGRRQAEAAARALERLEVRRIVTSPYTRALETAQILAAAIGLPVGVEPLVRERVAFACDVGTERSELSRRWPGLDFTALEERWWSETQESEAVVRRRSAGFSRQAARAEDWPHVVVVTHWGFIRALTGRQLANGAMLRIDPTGSGPPPAEVAPRPDT